MKTRSFPGLIILLAVGAAMLLSACQKPGSKAVQVTKADAGKTIAVKSGQQLSVVLEGNPTTGFTWETQPGIDETVLKPAGEPEFKADSNAIGSGGVMTMTYTAGQPGQVDLILLYHRPWEKNVDPLETFEVTVNVTQ